MGETDAQSNLSVFIARVSFPSRRVLYMYVKDYDTTGKYNNVLNEDIIYQMLFNQHDSQIKSGTLQFVYQCVHIKA